MIPITEARPPVDKPVFAYHWADYSYAPGFGCHLRTRDRGDEHPLLTDQITLSKPLSEHEHQIHTIARASDSQRTCRWCVFWHHTEALPNVFFADEKQGDEVFLLLFFQTKPLGHTRNFRLIVCPIQADLPKAVHFWKLIDQIRADLPSI
ncbi:hypothetical protein [Spirosoma areae]